ncbi:MAG: ATP-binding cassette domain-containing protein, partial [Arenibacterium sp.]
MQTGLRLRTGRIDLSDGDRAFSLRVDDLILEPGKTVALTGASGSGKTLLLELLGLLRQPGASSVYQWQGADGPEVDLVALWSQGPRNPDLALRRGHIFGFVPQTGGLMPVLDVAENNALAQQGGGKVEAKRCPRLEARLGL